MSSVVISGDTSGAITLSAPAVAGTNTLTLPAVTGNVLASTGQLIGNGTTTNNDASAGQVGEYISSTVTGGTSGYTSATATNATSISLTAGDWDVSGSTFFRNGGPSSLFYVTASISTTSNTLGADSNTQTITYGTAGSGDPSTAPLTASPIVRISIASTTTIYIVGKLNFVGSTFGIGGTIRARRIR